MSDAKPRHGNSDELESNYNSLMELQLNAVSPSMEYQKVLAHGIDASLALQREDGCQHAIALIESVLQGKCDGTTRSRLNFFLGNCWTNLRAIRKQSQTEGDRWSATETENAIRGFRSAVNESEFNHFEPNHKCQVLTNLAVEMRHLGRCIEAIALYDRAMELNPRFGMATGGKGVALCDFARSLTDLHDRIPLWREARALLIRSETERDFEVEASSHFSAVLRTLDPLHAQGHLDLTKHRVTPLRYVNKGHRNYAEWCYRNRLQLSPLNEVNEPAQDTLHLRSVSSSRIRSPALFGLINQLKQEFVAARFLFYEGKASPRAHWCDKGVTIVDTLDYPLYGIAVERIKTAFRLTYSLFDKIAHSINWYWKLGIAEQDVTFRSCWYRSKGQIHAALVDSNNDALRGLYWLSRDFFEVGRDGREPLDPMARQHYELRRRLEHRYVKIHLEWVEGGRRDPSDVDPFVDHLSYSINRIVLEAQTLNLLSLARAALSYLIMAINLEEARGKPTKLPGISLPVLPDDWKH